MKIAGQLNKMLSKGISGNQAQLVTLLQSRGIKTTQSTVSRALKKISAVKGLDENGNTTYFLPPNENGIKEPGFFDSLVHKIIDNGNLIVIHTRPGTANTVAKFIDDRSFSEVMGTVAGDDTIMIIPLDVVKTKDISRKIQLYLKGTGIF
jgi:transcriptional regulator of arginine metabolism